MYHTPLFTHKRSQSKCFRKILKIYLLLFKMVAVFSIFWALTNALDVGGSILTTDFKFQVLLYVLLGDASYTSSCLPLNQLHLNQLFKLNCWQLLQPSEHYIKLGNPLLAETCKECIINKTTIVIYNAVGVLFIYSTSPTQQRLNELALLSR